MKHYHIFLLMITVLAIGCESSAEKLAEQTAAVETQIAEAWTATPPMTSTATLAPTPTATLSPTLTSTPSPTPIPWDTYNMQLVIKIGGVGKLWMPIPREWDGIGMKDIEIIDIFPEPTEIYHDSVGNEIAYWEIYDWSSREYGIEFNISVSPIEYDIDPSNIGAYDITSETYQVYTAPTEYINSDAPEIIDLARRIIGDETNPYYQAERISNWVASNIAGGGECETALVAFQTRQCACGGFSELYVALLRAVGIPARTVSGFHTVYTNELSTGSCYEQTLHRHVWSEFYLPGYGWIQSDTTNGGGNFAQINEPRIITARGEIELGNGALIDPLLWFHTPHTNVLIGGYPRTQVCGEYYVLEVERAH